VHNTINANAKDGVTFFIKEQDLFAVVHNNVFLIPMFWKEIGKFYFKNSIPFVMHVCIHRFRIKF